MVSVRQMKSYWNQKYTQMMLLLRKGSLLHLNMLLDKESNGYHFLLVYRERPNSVIMLNAVEIVVADGVLLISF